jgi:hypothetical protein
MSRENVEIVRTAVAVVIAACLLKAAILGVGWDETAVDSLTQADTLPLDAYFAPASKSCGDFQIPGAARLKLEVVQGNVPCRVAQRVLKDQYRRVRLSGTDTGPWSCGGPQLPILQCEKTRGGEGTVRARFYCRDWEVEQARCLNAFGPR